MLARSAGRLITRRVLTPTFRPTTSRAAFMTAQIVRSLEVIHESHIPVTGYSGGGRIQECLQVMPEIVVPTVADHQSIARPLNPALIEHLTPTMAKFTLPGKIAVVTGGGRGLGLNMAQALTEVGISGVAILDVQQELGDKAARELSEQTGVDVRFYRVDVRDGNGVREAIQDVVDHYGRIDVLINAAGIA
ncbi:hypothetical protein LTR28_008401, partial [Elasticomyces elasticus]